MMHIRSKTVVNKRERKEGGGERKRQRKGGERENVNMCPWEGFRCLYNMGLFNKPVRPGLEPMMLLPQPRKGWSSKHGHDSFLCFL